MLLLRPPSESRIRQILEAQLHAGFSYPDPGQTRGSTRQGYQANHESFALGRGAAAFMRAQQAVRQWRMFDVGWIRLSWPAAPIEPGTTVAVLVRHFGFWSLNLCRIVYVIDEERR